MTLNGKEFVMRIGDEELQSSALQLPDWDESILDKSTSWTIDAAEVSPLDYHLDNGYTLTMQVYRIAKDKLYMRTIDRSKRIVVSFDDLEGVNLEGLKSGYKHGSIVKCKFSFDEET